MPDLENRIVWRTADALEQQNRMAEEQADLAEGVSWEIRYREGDLYDLVNITNTTKFGVQISGSGVLQPKTVDRFDGHSAEEFSAPAIPARVTSRGHLASSRRSVG